MQGVNLYYHKERFQDGKNQSALDLTFDEFISMHPPLVLHLWYNANQGTNMTMELFYGDWIVPFKLIKLTVNNSTQVDPL